MALFAEPSPYWSPMVESCLVLHGRDGSSGGHMSDDSYLDRKYFIDSDSYNCPFCNRRHVQYHLREIHKFDWSEEKKCVVVFVSCDSCKKESMHMSFSDSLVITKRDRVGRALGEVLSSDSDIDSKIFYSAPTSFFVIDSRIPSIVRELITEAEGCLKMNFLTGASACARKAIYELTVKEKAEGENYEEKIKSLNQRYQSVDPDLFDVLYHIQDMTSEKVHEQSWDKWNSNNLKLILETLKAVLHEIYVLPDEKKRRSLNVKKLRDQVRSKGKTAEPTSLPTGRP